MKGGFVWLEDAITELTTGVGIGQPRPRLSYHTVLYNDLQLANFAKM
jgi:hypothetical protein